MISQTQFLLHFILLQSSNVLSTNVLSTIMYYLLMYYHSYLTLNRKLFVSNIQIILFHIFNIYFQSNIIDISVQPMSLIVTLRNLQPLIHF